MCEWIEFARNREKALKYAHLDIHFKRMEGPVKEGLFAEMFGLVPMSIKTAKLIRSLRSDISA